MIIILTKNLIIAHGMYSKLLGSLRGKRMMEICDPYWVITSLSFHNIACKIEGVWFWKLRKFMDGLWVWWIQVLFWQLKIIYLSLFELPCQSCFPFSCSWKNHTFTITFTFTHEHRTCYPGLWSSHKKLNLPPK